MPAKPLRGLTVLVVDDHRDTVEMSAEYLDFQGGRAFSAASAEEAVAMLTEIAPDVVITDLRLTGKDGHWLLQQIRSSAETIRNVPVYALSGRIEYVPAPPVGFTGFFLKPVDLDALLAVLETL